MRQDPRHLGEGLDVVDERRVRAVAARFAGFGLGRGPTHLRCRREQAVLKRWEDAGERIVALDDFEERLLLTEEILVGTTRDRDVEVAEHTGTRQLACRAFDRIELALERRLHADVDVVRVDGERRDRGTGDDLIRIATHDRAVLERSGFSLRTVHDDVVP